MKNFIFAILTFALLLFLWNGLSQLLPWGIPTAQKITVQSEANIREVPKLLKLKPNTLTSPEFDTTFNHKISTYSTDATFSWIITQPLQPDYSGYFIREGFTQLIVGILLSLILLLTQKLKLMLSLALIGIIGSLAFVSTYGQLMNWWGLPASYALGLGINLILGWLLSSFIVSKYILKIKA